MAVVDSFWCDSVLGVITVIVPPILVTFRLTPLGGWVWLLAILNGILMNVVVKLGQDKPYWDKNSIISLGDCTDNDCLRHPQPEVNINILV